MGLSYRYGDALDDVPRQRDTGWSEVSHGMRQVALGWVLVLAGSVLGGALLWLGSAGYPKVMRLGKDAPEEGDLLLVGVGVLGVSLIMGCGAILIGQWRCLMHAPQRQGAKELMLVCVTCVLVGALLILVAPFLGGVLNPQTLRQGLNVEELRGLERLQIFRAEKLLALVGVCLILLNGVIFTQFLRTVADCFAGRRAVLGADLFTLFVGLLAGGSVGVFFCAHELSFKSNLVLAATAGWVAGVVVHALLIAGVRRCIGRGAPSAADAPALAYVPGSIVPSPPSGLHPLPR